MIIAFAGRAKAGKDLAGKYLIEHYKFLHYYFAKPLKEGCKHLFQLTDEQIANKETVIEPWGISPRIMYQRVGTDIGRTLDPNIWIKNAQMFGARLSQAILSDVDLTQIKDRDKGVAAARE